MSYGLKKVSSNNTKHAIVCLHGIRQTRDDIHRPFCVNLESYAGTSATIYAYGYDHTRHLTQNGGDLALKLRTIEANRIDLVGYSMGGLVCRLAATDGYNPAVHTVVTLATPNRGAMGNAQLTNLGKNDSRSF